MVGMLTVTLAGPEAARGEPATVARHDAAEGSAGGEGQWRLGRVALVIRSARTDMARGGGRTWLETVDRGERSEVEKEALPWYKVKEMIGKCGVCRRNT